jgi:hypothetical protein
MDHHKAVVPEFLQSDRTNIRCFLHVDEPGHPERNSHACVCDAVAIDLPHPPDRARLRRNLTRMAFLIAYP